VSSALIEVGEPALGFFTITVPGILLAGIGLVYVLFVAPRLLPDRAPMANALFERGGKQFVVQVTVSPDSHLVGQQAVGGFFPGLRDLTVMLLQRGEHAELPPFGELEIQPGDVMMVAATRSALEAAFAKDPGLLHPELGEGDAPPENAPWRVGNQVFAEAMVTPTSRLIGRNLEQIGFRYQYRCIVCGIQRRARMIRQRLTEIRLEPGDVLLLQGRRGDINALRNSPDVLLIEWTARDLPSAVHGQRALAIFAAVVLVAATGLAPIAIAAFCGAVAMIGVGTLNLRQAGRAIDRKVLLMIPTALALSAALDHTGGAAFLAHGVITLIGTAAAPAYLLSAMFLLIAALTNVLSNQATAVLFTPIAVGLAREMGVEPVVFAIAVVFAANCSFASPIGYQTNVLVLGPGHYRFTDFVRAGLPLILLLWLVFSLFAPWYYGF
jgi:di/tricarboxylate transporter